MHRSRSLTGAGALVLASCVVLWTAAPLGAQESARDQRERVRSQRATLALQVDALTADEQQVDRALRDLDANVRGQQGLLGDAERASTEAARRAEAADAAATARQAELDDLRARMARVAVDAYVNPPGASFLDRFQAESATVAAKKQALLDGQARRASDLVDQLRLVRHLLERDRDAATAARQEAERQQDDARRRLSDLTAARSQQAQFASEVEARLNAKLAEADALASVDAALAAQLRAEQAALVERLRTTVPPAPPPGPATPAPPDPDPAPGPGPGTPSPTSPPPAPPPPPVPPVPPPVPLVTVRGITVHQRIGDQLRSLLDAAAADGAPLSGKGYRDINEQIRLRRQHCGTSDYAVWQMPASRCSPPTAIPGTSMHEQGLAIDFTWGGGGIGSRDHPGYRWLAANAARYGFYNLPSKPWHWSVNGR